MALLLRKMSRLSLTHMRLVSSGAGIGNSQDDTIKTRNILRDPVRQVFISQSNDIFTNLALEDWIYQNHDFDHKSLLLLWRNYPCVVIGRHQNPWAEANVPYLRETCTKLARRNSGGGTVYHDLGNLNCTFFTRKSDYDRRRNLDVVCKAIKNIVGFNGKLDVAVNDRDDIVIKGLDDGDRKVSGTAAKLGRTNAYHHCTVLVDVNECVLHDALDSKADNVESRATQSVRVPVKNISQLFPHISVDALVESLGWQFLKTNVFGDIVGDDVLSHQRGFQLVRPDDVWFPGLEKLRQEFESNRWIFGKTPKFSVKQTIEIPEHIAQLKPVESVDIQFEVIKGFVENVKIINTKGPTPITTKSFVDAVQGLEFGPDLYRLVYENLDVETEELRQFYTGCVYDMVSKYI